MIESESSPDAAFSASHMKGACSCCAAHPGRRRDGLGISYISVNAAFSEQFAPVIELLAGR